MNMSYLTNKEFLILKHICSSKLRPKMYLSKKTGEFTPLEGLLIPSDHKYYESIEPDRGNFSKIKKQLIFKRVLYETDYGFVLNHNMIPFTSKATMAHLYKIASIPLPPTDK